jgi:integration host factor subunit beta
MIKSELVRRMASRNPHLYHRDLERIVDSVFDEITFALHRGDRVELRASAFF